MQQHKSKYSTKVLQFHFLCKYNQIISNEIIKNIENYGFCDMLDGVGCAHVSNIGSR
jgi:hypothetical protein